MIVGTLAIAQTIVILTAGIDLSIGAIMVFGQMFMANLAVYTTASNVTFMAGQNPALAVFVGIVVSTLASSLNGFLIVRSDDIDGMIGRDELRAAGVAAHDDDPRGLRGEARSVDPKLAGDVRKLWEWDRRLKGLLRDDHSVRDILRVLA